MATIFTIEKWEKAQAIIPELWNDECMLLNQVEKNPNNLIGYYLITETGEPYCLSEGDMISYENGKLIYHPETV